MDIQTEDTRFVRDTHSKALLNTDYNALQRHRKERAYYQNQQNEINIMKQKIEDLGGLSNEISEIKQMLKDIQNNRSYN
jgi:hypothetical protein